MSDATDREEVVAATIAYCWALDSRDWGRLTEVFTTDAVAELGGVYRGLDAITERVRSVLTPLTASQHTVSTHDVRVDGDEATSRCSLIAQHVLTIGAGTALLLVGGTYHDRLRRGPDGWRIVDRRLEVIWTDGDLSMLEP